MGRRWMYFALLTESMRDLRLCWTILGILKAFSWQWSTTSKMRRDTYPGQRKLLFEIKKGTFKTKKLLKIFRYIRWTRVLKTIRRASLKLRRYVFIKTWKVAVTASISENKLWAYTRQNPKQQHLKVLTFSDPSFNKKRIYVYDHEA